MISLSTLPGYNYASACSGYIDTIYDALYKNKSIGYNSPNDISLSHTNTTTLPKSFIHTNTGPQVKNQSLNEYNQRAKEVKELHDATSDTATLTQAEFQKTFRDLSFSEQIDITQKGYEPYKNNKAYYSLDIQKDEDRYKSKDKVIGDIFKQVYKCIEVYEQDCRQKSADYEYAVDLSEWAPGYIEEYGNITNHSSKDQELFRKATKIQKDTNFVTDAYNKKNSACTAATESPCTCTQKVRFRDDILKPLGNTCDDDTTSGS